MNEDTTLPQDEEVNKNTQPVDDVQPVDEEPALEPLDVEGPPPQTEVGRPIEDAGDPDPEPDFPEDQGPARDEEPDTLEKADPVVDDGAMVQVPASTLKKMMQDISELKSGRVQRKFSGSKDLARGAWQELDAAPQKRYAKLPFYRRDSDDEVRLVVDRKKHRDITKYIDGTPKIIDTEYKVTLLDKAGKRTTALMRLAHLAEFHTNFIEVEIIEQQKKRRYRKIGRATRPSFKKDGYRTYNDKGHGTASNNTQWEFQDAVVCLVRTEWGQEFRINANRLNLS